MEMVGGKYYKTLLHMSENVSITLILTITLTGALGTWASLSHKLSTFQVSHVYEHTP